MRITLRKFLALIAAASVFAAPAFAQTATPITDLQAGADSFSKALGSALPFNSTLGLNWSDAYIGQLLAVPPHFGVGATMGATTIKADKATALLSKLGFAGANALTDLPLPVVTAEARIGGFIIPFDIGVKAMILPQFASDGIKSIVKDLSLDYTIFGADFRYALLKGGLIMPTISVGVGFNYMKGGMSVKVPSGDTTFSFTDPSPTSPVAHTVSVTAPTIGLGWETTTLDFKAQISKSLLIVTPYLGLGAAYGWSKAGYYITSKVKYDGTELNDTTLAQLNTMLSALKVNPVKKDGINAMQDVNGLSLRVYGGASLNLLILKLDLTGLYNLSDGSYGATVGFRVQL